MGGAVAADFELDQWTFFKPTPGDLFRLYGIDLHEVQPYRGFPTLIATRLAAGQTVMPEVDSFYLPDVAATSYRTDHVKSTIVAESIDEDARLLRYFHNTGYHELSGEDYDKLFATYSGDGHLPTYVELLRFDAGPVPSGDSLRASPARCWLSTWPGARPRTRSPASPPSSRPTCPALLEGSTDGLPRLRLPQPADGRRLDGAAGRPRALAVRRGRGEGRRAARRRGRRLEDAAVPAGPAARLRRGRRGRPDGRGVRRRGHRARRSGCATTARWPDAAAVAGVRSGLHARAGARTPDARSVRTSCGRAHVRRRRSRPTARARGRRHRHGLGPAGRRRGGRSGQSMFERHEMPIAAGDHEVRDRRAPADRAARDPAHASRGSAGGPCWSRRRSCGGSAPSCSAGPPASRPGHRWSGRTGRSRWSPDRGPTELRAWLEGTTGVVEVDGRTGRVPRGRALVAAHARHAAAPRRDRRRRGGRPGRVPDHREPVRGLPGPLGQRRPGVLPRRGVDAG